MYCDCSISEASMYMSMHCEVWTEVSRLALGPLVLIRARFCPRGPRWVYLILGLGLTDSLHIFDIHNFDHIPNFGWWRISTRWAGHGWLRRLPKVGRWSGSGWVGVGQGGDAHLGWGRHRTLSRSDSWQLWVRSHQRATWHLCPCSCTFASLLLALGVARGLSWLRAGAMEAAARPAVGPRAAPDPGRSICHRLS